jgi:ankyrin repeat protein
VDQQSNTEDTALHLSSQYGYSGVVEFLLERHANPMMKNVHGETPLDLAAQFGHIDTVSDSLLFIRC